MGIRKKYFKIKAKIKNIIRIIVLYVKSVINLDFIFSSSSFL